MNDISNISNFGPISPLKPETAAPETSVAIKPAMAPKDAVAVADIQNDENSSPNALQEKSLTIDPGVEILGLAPTGELGDEVAEVREKDKENNGISNVIVGLETFNQGGIKPAKVAEKIHENVVNDSNPPPTDTTQTDIQKELDAARAKAKEATSNLVGGLAGRVISGGMSALRRGNTWLNRGLDVFTRVLPFLELSIPTLLKIRDVLVPLKITGTVLSVAGAVITLITAPIGMAKAIMTRNKLNAHTEQIKGLPTKVVLDPKSNPLEKILAERKKADDELKIKYEVKFEGEVFSSIKTKINDAESFEILTKDLANSYGVHIENLELEGSDEGKLTALKEAISKDKPEIKESMKKEYVQFEQTLQPLARNAMQAMGLAKQQIEKDVYKFSFTKMMVMAPIGIVASSIGIAAFVAAMVATPFPPVAMMGIAFGVLALSTGFSVAGLAHGLYHKPHSMMDSILHFRGMRQSFREIPVLWSQFQVSRLEAKKLELTQQLVSNIPDSEKVKLKEEIDKVLLTLDEAKKDLGEREKKLKKHTDAAAKAGIKDMTRKQPGMDHIFKESEQITLIDVIDQIHQDGTTDPATTHVLQTVHGLDSTTLKGHSVRDDFMSFYGGSFQKMDDVAKRAFNYSQEEKKKSKTEVTENA